MSMQKLHRLPPAEQVAEQYPVTAEHQISERRAAVKSVIDGTDPNRLLMVVGPCSAWPSEAVCEYADLLSRLQEDLNDRLLLVMRTYLQKPRTIKGWPGPLEQPDPLLEKNIPKGIMECRRMLHRVGKQLPLADEALHPDHASYIEPLLSYIAIGARSTLNQKHRFVASGFDTAVGIKNPTSGNIAQGVDGVEVAQGSHVFEHQGYQVRSSGNPHAHIILRGGGGQSNYGPHSIAQTDKLLCAEKRGIVNPAIIVDASHDNSLNGHGKDETLQSNVIHSVMYGVTRGRKEYRNLRGFMMESFIKGGNQPISSDMDRGGLSITDPCLSWKDTEELLRETADQYDRSI